AEASAHADTRRTAAELSAEVAVLRADLTRLETTLTAAVHQRELLGADLEAVRASETWRVGSLLVRPFHRTASLLRRRG
ncbi:MAG: hypothetical protein WCD35_10585, partial [Mycobacteriales bacterium]